MRTSQPNDCEGLGVADEGVAGDGSPFLGSEVALDHAAVARVLDRCGARCIIRGALIL